jgi:RNA polymerase sigma-70 factor (ECF subfamily)
VDTTEPTSLEIIAESDTALMLRVRDADDRDAFAELAGRYRGPLTRFFASVLSDAALADDGAQETLLRLWLLRARYQPTGRFSAYLFQIARHHYLNQRERYRAREVRETSTEIGNGVELELPPHRQPEAILLERLEQARRERAIVALPERYRTVFTLSHFDGLSYAEIACRLDIPIGTVKSRMAEAVRRLRRTLEENDE